MGENLVLTRGYETCLILVNEKSWQYITQDISNASYGLKEMREASRFLVGGAAEVDLDSQGRFVLPDNLLQYANLDKKVVFVGLMKWVEIWDADTWLAKDSQLHSTVTTDAQKLNEILNKSI